MTIDSQFLDRLRGRITLSQLIATRVALKPKGRLFYGCCPFHKEKTPSFKVDDERANYHCFGCHVSGDAISFLMETDQLNFIDAVTKLAEMAGLDMPVDDKPRDRKDPGDRSLEIIEKACTWFEQLLDSSQGLAAKEYILSRGITHASIKQFRLGYTLADFGALRTKFIKDGYTNDELVKTGLLSISERTGEPYDRFRGRLMFPIQDPQGHVIGFGARTLDGTEPKYLNSSESPWFQKGELLYGQFQSKNLERQKPLIVTEGYLDVISLVQTGRYRSVAPLGTAITEQQISKLFRLSHEPIMCFDGDSAGQRAMDRAAERALACLRPVCYIHFAHLPEKEDPDSLVQKGALDVLDASFGNPTPLVDTLWHSLIFGLDLSLPERRADLKKSLDRLVAKIQDPDIRSFYQQEYQNRLRQLVYGLGKGRKQVAIGKPQVRLGLTKRDKVHIQREILLATVLNHPHILDSIEEDFASLTFQGDLERIHKHVLETFHALGILDNDGLKKSLEDKGMADVANDLINRVYLHAPFVKPDTSAVDVLEGWNGMWDLYQMSLGGAQHEHELRQKLEENLDTDSWEKFKQLQQTKQNDDF